MEAPRKPLRVMIVEDSPVVRTLLAHIISADPRLSVADAVGTGEEAIAHMEAVRPDVITMDIHLPGIDGLEATRRIMAARPTPIVVVSGLIDRQALSAMDALRAGALSVVEKPVGVTSRDYATVASDICTQLVIMSEVAVVRRRLRSGGPARFSRVHHRAGSPPRVAVIASSTGGPQALAKLLGALSPELPLPLLLVQHMGPAFMDGFARWLDGVVPLDVVVATDGTVPTPGRVHVAPGDRHLLVHGERMALDDGPAIKGQRPAATALFASAAQAYGPAAIGVVLTGMGEDGAVGVEQMLAAGATVFAEEEASAVVYGMPAAAVRAGAVPLPIEEIAAQITRAASRATITARS